MNTTIRFFQTKEQYIAYRAAFASAQNSPRAKKSFTEVEIDTWDGSKGKYGKAKIKVKSYGWLTAEHFLLLNLIRSKPFYKGFTPKNSKAFIDNGGNADRALSATVQRLTDIIHNAKTLLDPSQIRIPSWRKDKDKYISEQTQTAQKTVNAFLEVYGGALTLQDLARVRVPNAISTSGEKSYDDLGLDTEDSIVEQTPVVVGV